MVLNMSILQFICSTINESICYFCLFCFAIMSIHLSVSWYTHETFSQAFIHGRGIVGLFKILFILIGG